MIADWFRNWYKSVQTSDNNDLLSEISDLELENEHLIVESLVLQSNLDKALEELESLKTPVISSDKHFSIGNYKDWLFKNVLPVKTFYDYGSGRKEVHTIFKESLKDEAIIRAFIVDDLKFLEDDFRDADELVYKFNTFLSSKYPTKNYYAFDTELYGKREYWALAKTTIEKLKAGGKSYDCDDSMILRYSCLYFLLKDYFSEETWRLRGFIVDLWSGGGHAMLGWVKSGVNDWVPIETTFRDVDQSFIWRKDYTIRDQLFYQIRYSFDDEHEYTVI
jgi:hypothetical protein